MRTELRSASKGVEVLLRLSAFISGMVLVGVALAIVVNALLRLFVGISILGIIDVSGPLLAVAIFLALPLSTLTDTHVKVIMLSDHFPRSIGRFLRVFGALSVAVMCGTVGYWMYFLTVDAAEIGMTTLSSPIRLAPFMAVGMVGAWLAAVAGIILAIRELRSEPDA